MSKTSNAFKIVVSVEKFESDAAQFTGVRKSDFLSYKEFINYFKEIQVIRFSNLCIAINFTYGWMPTIFEFTSDKFDESLVILNKVKRGDPVSATDILVLKSVLNNSLVGTTKLLHFIRPDEYPIWDSRVYRYLTGMEPYDYRISNIESYLVYKRWVEQIVLSPLFKQIHQSIVKVVGFEISAVRAAELVMYQAGGKR